MKQLPVAPSQNERVLAQEYREVFTGITGPTVTLAHTPIRTIDDVGLELVFRNGVLLDAAAPGASSATRETFTGITAAFFTLASKPVVGAELLFRNGELIDGRAAKTAAVNATVSATVWKSALEHFTGSTSTSITLAHSCDGNALVAKNGAVLTPTTDYSVSGATLTLSSRASGDHIVVWYQYTASASGTATQTLTVDPAAGTYTIDADGKITPSVAPVASDVFVCWYLAGGASGGGSAGYTISGNTLTLATDLVESDQIVILYPYRA